MKYKIYEIPLLKQEIIFAYFTGEKQLLKILNNPEIKKWLKKMGIEYIEITYGNLGELLYIKETGRPILIFVNSGIKDKNTLYETISHECTHAVFYLQRLCNFVNENEFTAYVSGRIISDFISFVGK